MATQESRQPPAFFYGYVIVLATFIIAVVVEGLLYSFGVFFEPLLSEFGWTRAVTSGAFSLSAALRIPAVIVAGRLSDRFGSRQVLTACGLFLGSGYLLLSLTTAVWQLYLFYGVLVAIGMGLYWVPLISIVPRWFVRRRALMMGIVTSGIGVGQLLYPPLVSRLISTYGWRLSYLIMGGVSMVVILISAWFLKRNPAQLEPLSPEVSGASVSEAVRTRRFWMFCGAFLSWMFCLGVVLVHSVVHAIDLGMAPKDAANILAIIGVAGIIGRPAFGRLADKVGIKPALQISLFLLAVNFLWLVLARETWMIHLFAAVFGIAYGTFEMLESSIVADLFGLGGLSTILGVAFAFGAVGFILGPVVAGHIFDVAGSYHLAFLISAVMALLSLTSASLLPLSRHRGGQVRQ
jgi:MFS family permease